MKTYKVEVVISPELANSTKAAEAVLDQGRRRLAQFRDGAFLIPEGRIREEWTICEKCDRYSEPHGHVMLLADFHEPVISGVMSA